MPTRDQTFKTRDYVDFVVPFRTHLDAANISLFLKCARHRKFPITESKALIRAMAQRDRLILLSRLHEAFSRAPDQGLAKIIDPWVQRAVAKVTEMWETTAFKELEDCGHQHEEIAAQLMRDVLRAVEEAGYRVQM